VRILLPEEEKRQEFQVLVGSRLFLLGSRRSLTNPRRNGFNFVSEAETFPLVLSVGIFIQSFIFAGVQSRGLDNFRGRGCIWIAQLMLPGK
jgi:hypothetical protein